MSAFVNDSPPLEAVPLQEVPPLPAAAEPVNVYLVAPPRGGLNVIPLGWLAQLFGLDTAGDSMLTRRAALGMRNAAVVMLVVYIFDFCAWLLFFNSVFHSQDDVLKGDELTLLAGVFALLLSTATIIYERDFFCHDPDETRRRRAGALIIRLTVIAVTALATASTVDILLFRGPIRERIHQESVLSTLTAQWHKIEEQQKIAADAQIEFEAAETQAKKQLEADKVKEANKEVEAIQTQRKGAAGQLQSAVGRSQQLARDIARYERQRSELDPARDGKRIQALTQNIDYLNRLLQSTQQMIPILQSSSFQLDQQHANAIQIRDTAYTELLKKRDTLQQLATDKKNAAIRAERDLRVFIEKLKGSKPGEPVPEFGDGKTPNRAPDGREGLVARDRESNFFDQVRIIRDLMAGADPKWSGIDATKAESLAGQFGIDYQAAKTDEKRATRQQNMFNIAVAGVTGIGFMIPLLILAMKLIAPLELRAYYSTGRQALAGNAEATLLRAVDAHYTARERRRGANGEDAT
jgi:hypothetical protein